MKRVVINSDDLKMILLIGARRSSWRIRNDEQLGRTERSDWQTQWRKKRKVADVPLKYEMNVIHHNINNKNLKQNNKEKRKKKNNSS